MSILLKIVTVRPLPQHAAAPLPYHFLSASIYHPSHLFISLVCAVLCLPSLDDKPHEGRDFGKSSVSASATQRDPVSKGKPRLSETAAW